MDVVRRPDGAERATPGGGPFNTARALARLGVQAAFLGHLSDDAYGRELARLLASDGASLELASVGHEKTTIAVAEVGSDGAAEFHFVFAGTSAPQLLPEMLPARLAANVTALHIGTLGLVFEPIASTLAAFVRGEHGGRCVMLDPNIRPGLIPDDAYRSRLHDMIALSTIVKCSEADLAWLYPGVGYEDATRLLLDEGVRLAAVTLGARGAFAAHRDFAVNVEATAVEVVDTIGAGDTFGAAMLAYLHDRGRLTPDLQLERSELRAALAFACRAAAITCSRPGADPPWKGEV